ncbi:glycosyltransferase [Gracilinema caldarium]|uniref:Glycosyl transferase family 2 n=1 Tax=Gracilinema caldarium (strain ATCC 51460 / DSM 7334 / H1) TaxID=744872 RepID=F8F2A7_GRAC1|nr:glycosyltransferase [Gracilinema caldarium]AEJ20889.1 glycosyl transferase family 2 [Gracilinema caldarium DSM 7334]
MLVIFTIFFFIIFVGLHLVLMAGLYLEYRRDLSARNNVLTGTISVSIIIPVHNEANRISALLKSLLKQDYPLIELLFIDDRSTDETASIIHEFSKQFNLEGHLCRLLQLTENPGPNYKQFGLIKGFEAAAGELVLLTDADCELPTTWVSGMVKRMSNLNTGLVIGPVFKKTPQASFLYKTQAFDHVVRYGYLAASTAIGAPGGGFGNNMAVRKSVLDAAGGYGAVPFSVTEDAALISFINQKTPCKIRASLGPDIHVLTETEPTWKQFFIQGLRWTKGGIFSPDRSTRLSFNMLMLMISLGMVALPLLVLESLLWPLPVAVWVAMSMNTIAAIVISGEHLKDLRPIDFLIQIFIIPMLNVVLTLMVLLRLPVYWKGKKV